MVIVMYHMWLRKASNLDGNACKIKSIYGEREREAFTSHALTVHDSCQFDVVLTSNCLKAFPFTYIDV